MNANLGHGNSAVAAAMGEQARGLVAVPTIAGDVSDSALALAERIRQVIGIPDATCTFMSSGSEATEAALAVVWKYWSELGQPRKQKIISLDGSYHGCTLGALALTGRTDEHLDIPSLIPTFRLALPAWDPSDASRVSRSLEKLLESIDVDDIGAIFLEPIMGLAGMIPAAVDDISKVVTICRKNNILVVLDEALTGLGRAGRVTAAGMFGLDYDLLLMSKGLGCGFTPIATTCIASHVASVLGETVPALRHGHTSSGNPLAARVAQVVLDQLVASKAVENALQMGEVFEQLALNVLSGIGREYPVRATGLCLAVETDSSEYAQGVRRRAFDLGLRIRAIDRNIILCPPLIIERKDMLQMVSLLTRAILETERASTGS